MARLVIESNYRREVRMGKSYGLLNFLGDVFMVAITGGLWFIWIFVREMRRR